MVVGSTNSSGANLNIAAKQDGPKGGGHDYRDVGGRATQEQLPRMPGIILHGPLFFFFFIVHPGVFETFYE